MYTLSWNLVMKGLVIMREWVGVYIWSYGVLIHCLYE